MTPTDPTDVIPAVTIDNYRWELRVHALPPHPYGYPLRRATLTDLAAVFNELPLSTRCLLMGQSLSEFQKKSESECARLESELAALSKTDEELTRLNSLYDGLVTENARLESELREEREAAGRLARLDAEMREKFSAELLEMHRKLVRALELVREYEAQWGGEYLAKKWGLKDAREAIENDCRVAAEVTGEGGK